MRFLTALLAASLALFLSACGGDDDGETTVVSTSTVTATSTAPTDDDGGSTEGVMTPDGIGDVRIGDSYDEVVATLGEPDSEEELPGCELGTDPQPQRQLSYELGDGRLAVTIDAERDELLSYFTDSPSLETDHGDSVGDSWETLKSSWGAALDPVVLGAEPTPEAGSYMVGQFGENQLIFDLEDRAVARISGGFLPPCE